MKIAQVAAMLLACTDATSLHSRTRTNDIEDRDTKLSQSVASAFNMEPPKLMNSGDLPKASMNGKCPAPGQKLTSDASGGAFLDGCYMNTTRAQERNEATGEEAQNYLYMWKHACAFTKWVPSNQFMYSGIDYNEETMTLERFGFIGMEKKCFWGSIGVLWKRPLPVEQILPNSTLITVPPKKPEPKPEKPKPKPEPEPYVQPPPRPPKIPETDRKTNERPGKNTIRSVKRPGNDVEVREIESKSFTLAKSKKDDDYQKWKFVEITHEIISIESYAIPDKFFQAYELNATDGTNVTTKAIRMQQTATDEWKTFGNEKYREDRWPWFRLLYVEGKVGATGEEDVYVIEAIKYPGYYMVDPGQNGFPGFELR